MLFLSRLILQLSLYSWLRDIREELVRLDSTTTVFALVVNTLESSRVPCIVDDIDWELDRVMLMVLLGCTLLKHSMPAFL